MKPIVYVTHYIREEMKEVNDVLIDMLHFMEQEQVTPEKHDVIVVYWCPEDEEYLMDDIRTRKPGHVQLLRNTRPGPAHCQPSQRNAVVMDARKRGKDQVFVLLHNDARPTPGWLSAILGDLQGAEKYAGKGNAIMIPRYAHYVWRKPVAKMLYEDAWAWLRSRKTTHDFDQLREWCIVHGIAMEGNFIRSKQLGWSAGEALMMFAARAEVFDRFGLCNEEMLGWGYDDDDWALRAMANGVANCKSKGSFVEHIIGLAFYHPSGAVKKDGYGCNNRIIFEERWGMEPKVAWERAWNGTLGKEDAPDGPYYELKDVKEIPPPPAPPRKGPSLLSKLMKNGPPPKVVEALINHLGQVQSMIDVGSGEHGPVGQHYWQQTAAKLHALDIYGVRDMPAEWTVHKMDMRKMMSTFGSDSFDVIQSFDTIEHLCKLDGRRWLEEAQQMAKRAVLVFTPDGFVDSPAAVGSSNPHQKHQCGWEAGEFTDLGFEVEKWGPGYIFALWRRG